ncbi:MAG: glycosyl hydrolase family 65 protein [Nocardioides sp.]|uniref:glycoside hydrolase family 65 protein n=1 Tax=Nocardioides sp. TaxID=35761 RepID=UPI0039E49B24
MTGASTTVSLDTESSSATWEIREDGFDRERAGYHESLMTVGNGRLGTRASLEEGHLGALSGTYLAGVYDAHDSPVIDLVNVPDWLATRVWVEGRSLDVDTLEVVEHERVLDLRTGVLTRATVFIDPAIGRVRLASARLASMADRDLCAQRIEVTALDRPVEITVVTGIETERRNLDRLPAYTEEPVLPASRRWEKWARSNHLRERERHLAPRAGDVVTETLGSGVRIAVAYDVRPQSEPTHDGVQAQGGTLATALTFEAAAGEPIVVEKVVAYATSRDPGRTTEPRVRALETIARHRSSDFAALAAASREVWARLWADSEVRVSGHRKDALALHLGTYHLLIAANPEDPTVSIGAKSLSGEGYRGHVFWDSEILLLPFFLYTQPSAARALLSYRHHTLPGARRLSAANGTRGARYPWEAADTGAEECPRWTPDGQHRFWTRDEELHVTADVAYGVMQYVAATGDTDFLLEAGAEILVETARYWVSRLERRDDGTLSLSSVMGPDEFHSHVDDNAFTNQLVRWHLEQAGAVASQLATAAPERGAIVATSLGPDLAEVEEWARAAAAIRPGRESDDGVIEQFAGYFERQELPISTWDKHNMPQYPAGYHHFNLEDTTLLKQPDVVMLMYLLPDEYSVESQRVNFEFYEARTLHKSSLSPPIHAIVGLRTGDSAMAVQYFERAAYVDLDDNQGNTAEGMHIAAAGGTWQVAVLGFGGMRLHDGRLSFTPHLPERWDRLEFTVGWHGRRVAVDIDHDGIGLTLCDEGAEVEVEVGGQRTRLRPGTLHRVPNPC